MERYLLFVGYIYYPVGGMSDLVNDFATEEEARAAWKSTIEYDAALTWAHILDTLTGEVINLRS